MSQYFQVKSRLKKAEQQAQEPPLLQKIQGQMEELRTQHTQALQRVKCPIASPEMFLSIHMFSEFRLYLPSSCTLYNSEVILSISHVDLHTLQFIHCTLHLSR